MALPSTHQQALDKIRLLGDLSTDRRSFLEKACERAIRICAGLAIAAVALIFLFVVKEAMPIMLNRLETPTASRALSPTEAKRLGPAALARYLGQPEDRIRAASPAVVEQLVSLRAEELATERNPDAAAGAATLPMLFKPHQWNGYDSPQAIWQPTGRSPKYNILPLLAGSLKVSALALLVALPLGIGSAFYVSQIAPIKLREIIKPLIEMLAGFPTVVLGFLGLVFIATFLQSIFGYETRLNAFAAGVCVGLAILPLLFSISEDALSSVPSTSRDAALAMGATPWQASASVVLPAAMPGILAAVLLTFGRAFGETMIAMMVTGMAAQITPSLFDSARTVPATIGAELAEAVAGGPHYTILFFLGFLVFIVCFIMNLIGGAIIHRLKARLEGRTAPDAPLITTSGT